MRHGEILFAKGDLIQLIHNAGDFEQQGYLWDSAHNLCRMAEMQNDMLNRCNALHTFTHLYGGLVPQQYIVPGGPGSPGQPKKLYAPLPPLMTVKVMDEHKVDALIN